MPSRCIPTRTCSPSARSTVPCGSSICHPDASTGSPGSTMPTFLPWSSRADGRTLVSGDSHGGLIAWDVEHRVLRERLEGHAAEVATVVTTPDGRTAITAGSDDGKVAFWDLDDSRRLVRGVPLASRFVADESTPRGVAVSPDDRTLAVTHERRHGRAARHLHARAARRPRGVRRARRSRPTSARTGACWRSRATRASSGCGTRARWHRSGASKACAAGPRRSRSRPTGASSPQETSTATTAGC